MESIKSRALVAILNLYSATLGASNFQQCAWHDCKNFGKTLLTIYYKEVINPVSESFASLFIFPQKQTMAHNTQINTDWDLMCCAARWLTHSLAGWQCS